MAACPRSQSGLAKLTALIAALKLRHYAFGAIPTYD